MGARCRADDCRDREQWDALLALVTGRRGSGAGHRAHRFPGRVWPFHRLDLDPV